MNAKQIHQLRVRANQARREAERPVREGRRPLAEAVSRGTKTVERWQAKVAKELCAQTFGFGGWRLEEHEYSLANAERALQSRLTNLRVYDAAHNIDADYTVPVLDRDAIVRDARAEREAGMADIRARMQRPQPEPSPSAPQWAPIEPPEDLFP